MKGRNISRKRDWKIEEGQKWIVRRKLSKKKGDKLERKGPTYVMGGGADDKNVEEHCSDAKKE